jgi:hypothetical protein
LTPKADNFGAHKDVFNKKRVGDITYGKLSDLIAKSADEATTSIGLQVAATANEVCEAAMIYLASQLQKLA